MWFVQAVRSRSGMGTDRRIALELVDAYNNTGSAVKKREDTHKMAEANQAFAHFAHFKISLTRAKRVGRLMG